MSRVCWFYFVHKNWRSVMKVGLSFRRALVFLLPSCLLLASSISWVKAEKASNSGPDEASAEVHSLKITLLSTMLVGDHIGIGEWGFSALIEADGHRVLLDTGGHPETVLQNARDLNIDLSNVEDVILTHNHWDHVSGLMALRREMMKRNPAALSRAYVANGIFYSRPSPHGERNTMIAIKQEYEASGGKFIELHGPSEIFSGAWLTGPIPRKYPEHNWSSTGKVQTPAGLVEDTIPEDQSLILNTTKGLVVVTGCGHAGIINILTFATQKFPNEPVDAVIGGLHLFPATDQQLNWTANKLKDFKVSNLVGAHCTGIEAVYRIRETLGLPRDSAVVGTVGSTFVLGDGIHPGPLAK
jgi:7,8-dihydropterin-6-yl-methyl-4-(beta-D-ribofuranosyl)aminobenzene 5'-phosphate synthase